MSIEVILSIDFIIGRPSTKVAAVEHIHPTEKEASMSLINTAVKPFKAQAYHNGKFVEVTEASLQGKW